jgi:hypothetical protein
MMSRARVVSIFGPGVLLDVEVRKALAAHVRLTKFTQLKIPGSAIPPHGDDATRRGSQES